MENSSMFTIPEKLEDHAKHEENLFHTIPLEEVFGELNLFESVEVYLTRKLNVLKVSVQKFLLVIGLHAKHFDETQFESLKEVKGLNPQRIDWSNIPDCMKIQDFFTMARSCSVDNTEREHTFHLLNWIAKVFGASLFDYFLPDLTHENFIDKNGKTRKLYMELERDFMALVERDIGNMLLFKIDPKLLDIINMSERALSHRYFGDYVGFMFKNMHVKTLTWKPEPYSPFSRANTQGNVRFLLQEEKASTEK